MVIEKFSSRVKEGFTAKVTFEAAPRGDEKTTHVVIWSRASIWHSSGVPFSLFSLELCNPHPAQLYMEPLGFLWKVPGQYQP